MMRWGRGLLVGWALLAGGCADDVESEPVQASGSTLCLADFEACINPILDTAIHGRTGEATCSSSGCHAIDAGSGGAFKIYADAAPGSSEMLANFYAARAFANLDSPPDSKLLLEPLQGSASITGTHTGGDIFPSTEDACYAAILQWVAQRVDDEGAAACGSCVAPAPASCGYP